MGPEALPAALPPGSCVGILGGGQLGRMLAMAAARLGMRTHVFEPGDAPAAQVAGAVTRAGYGDVAALRAFAAGVDVVTYEFENVDLAAVDVLAPLVPVRPGRRALEVAQDRLAEKEFLRGLGLATAPFRAVDGPEGLAAAMRELGAPAILKTRRFGYDGKGQVRLDAGASAGEAWVAVGEAPSVLEGFVAFEREISVIAARGLGGEVAAYDPGENVHREGILARTTVPARVSAAVAEDAVLVAGRILNALDYVGVIGVEMFVTRGGLVVNEIAPRVHNSGHWTEAACLIDQFEQHVRAICGWPLGDGARHSDAEMLNLLGDEAAAAAEVAGARLHLYGKAEARPGRKMGHLTRIAPKSQ
jgi:5-(carboxyamino)imidazole ribonucleotide synthase